MSRAGRPLLVVACVALAAVAAACTDHTVSPSSSGFTAPRVTTTTAPRAAPGTLPPAPPGTRWTRVLADTFARAPLDRGRWSTCYPWATGTCTNRDTGETELYTPGNVAVAGGALQLTARRERVTDPLGTFPYTSGMVSTATPERRLFAFRYGFVRARMLVPAGTGLWSAFWLMPADGHPQPEIDVAEFRGGRPATVSQFVHWLDADHLFGNDVSVPTATTAWHTYAVDWELDAITWYVDGQRTWTMAYAPAVAHEDMVVVVNLAVGGHFAHEPTGATPFPASLLVDSVEVWQHS